MSDAAETARALWLASRPSQVALVALVYALGVGMARALIGAAVSWDAVGVGAAALLGVALGVHYANEYADVETDRLTERTPFSGGSGAVERTGIGRTVLARAATVATLLGLGGAVVGWSTGRLSVTALALLASIAVAGLAYSLPPAALVRRGVGELTNAVLGGTLLPLYGVAVVGRVSATAVLAVLPFTLLVGCNLLATHWPDREADAAVGKRTLAVRWSLAGLRRAYWLLATGAVALTVGLTGRVLPVPVVAAQALALPALLWGGAVLTRQRSPFPAVSAMVVHAGASAFAWWWLAPG
ncbi:prenyltransferase [Haloarcula onubensis]|uniref:Prenyltransferase n=1 Tax=Haloarcula onubensis TaxID=2950539 RepID=A0ABU2FSI2_9EURY|nr:prenyltransferase [Halomicroarcula sp. S3CR25-11]MDS0283725.1 prenyltransferase [Halomicroarcula sp. S3CR25-11]